jgi:phosphoglycolate phosphatase-like HAD superfamily hydrolase
MVIKAIGFDFDGTLIMSEDKKGREMAKVFLEKFKIKRGVKVAYERLIGTGLNRDQKVAKLFNQFLKRTPKKHELKLIADHFGYHYAKSLNKCPLYHCTDMLKSLRKKVRYLFLLSLENKREVQRVAKHCGVSQYFDEILGGPKSKNDNLKHVLHKHHVKHGETIYIGDAHSDVIVSKKLKIHIILLGKKHSKEKLPADLEADSIYDSLCKIPFKLG